MDMAETNQQDPYAFMVELCHISSSQEQLLHRSPFVGETVTTANSHDDGKASQCSCEIPVASTGIVMVSLPETQDSGKDSSSPQDVFHTPPEESSLPSSDDQRRKVSVDHCTVYQAVGVDDGTQVFVDFGGYSEGTECVDLGRDSDLGFLEVQLTQVIDSDLVAECPRIIEGDVGVSEVSKCQLNEFGVLEREFSLDDDDLGESPLKKLKLPEQNSGLDSSRDGFGIESLKVEEGMGISEGKSVSDTERPCNFGDDLQPEENVLAGEQISVDAGNNDNSINENLGFRENVKTQVVQSETIGNAEDVNFCEADELPCMIEGNKSSDDVIETSERQKRIDEQPGLPMLPSSIRGCLENAAKGLECGEGREEKIISIFDVLKVLSEKVLPEDSDDEDSLENVSLLDAVKIRGITFPRPRWWPDNDNYRKQRIA